MSFWRTQETIIECQSTGAPIAWFPAVLHTITTHPSGRSWAGGEGNHLYTLTLEGEAKTDK